MVFPASDTLHQKLFFHIHDTQDWFLLVIERKYFNRDIRKKYKK